MSEGTRRAVAWAAQAWGRTVHDVSRLSGGWTSTMLGLTGRAVADRCARDRLEQHLAAVLAESRVGGPTPANRLRPATEVEHSSG
ncbi:MAG: hypothetical protein ACXVXB_05380 [Nocardioidaceae bacterium]